MRAPLRRRLDPRGPLSGLHINPAVTFAFTARGVFPPSGSCRTGWSSLAGPSAPACSLIGACIAVIIIGLVRGLPGRSEQAAAEGADLPMQNETD